MIGSDIGNVNVLATSNRGASPDEYAAMARRRILATAASAPQPIRDQAEAFGDEIEKVIAHFIKSALRSDRTTIQAELVRAGHPELAEAVKRL